MHMRLRLALIIPTVLLALAVCQAAFAESGGNRYVVMLKDDATAGSVLASYTKGLSVFDVYSGAVNGFAAHLTPTGVSRIGAAPGPVAGASTGGAGVGVVVIDSGIDLTHPDLQGVQTAINCINHAQSVNDDN